MTFSEYAGVAIIPTFARLVLAAAFITAGYNKVFRTAEYDAEKASILQSMGVSVTPVSPVTHASPRDDNRRGESVMIVPAAYRPPQDNAASGTNAVPPATLPAATRPTLTNALPPGTYSASSMYNIALLVHQQNWGLQPVHEKWLAWIASYGELLGGLMLLVGLLSRFWGLVLAVQMAMAFYLVTMNPLTKNIGDYLTWAEDLNNYRNLYLQLSLLVLALGVMLTGPGPLSLDRLFFGGARKPINPPPPPPDRPMRLEPIGSNIKR